MSSRENTGSKIRAAACGPPPPALQGHPSAWHQGEPGSRVECKARRSTNALRCPDLSAEKRARAEAASADSLPLAGTRDAAAVAGWNRRVRPARIATRRSAARSLGDPAEFTRRGPESAGQVALLTSLPGSSAPQPRETQKRRAPEPDSPRAARVAARCRAKPHRARSHWPQVAALRPTGSPSCALIIGPQPCGPPRIGSGGGPKELPLATGAACPSGLAVGTARFRPCPARPPPRAPPKFRGVGAAGAVGPALRAPFRVPPSAPPGNPALRGGPLAMARAPWTRR